MGNKRNSFPRFYELHFAYQRSKAMLLQQAWPYMLPHIRYRHLHKLYNGSCLYVGHIRLRKPDRPLRIFCKGHLNFEPCFYLHWLARCKRLYKQGKGLQNFPFLLFPCFQLNKFHKHQRMFHKRRCSFLFPYFPFFWCILCSWIVTPRRWRVRCFMNYMIMKMNYIVCIRGANTQAAWNLKRTS